MTAEPGGEDTTASRFSLGSLTPDPAASAAVPAVFADRYEVGQLLGSGGTSRVYRAYDRRLRRDVAIKVYDREAIPVEQSRRLREMSIHGSLDHPAVVPLHDCGTEDGWTYLVMQCVEGQNLAERLRTGPVPADEVIALAIRLTEALSHLHAKNVTHRDIKPANVLLGPDGPLLTDFGIAYTLDLSRVTSTGTVPGTAAYMAPEQVLGESAGPPADVYALGLVLLECVTGEREYPGTMAESAVVRLTRQPRVPAGLPPVLTHVLPLMTARDPENRPTSDAVHLLLTKPEDAAPTAPLPRRPSRTRHVLAAAGLTAAAGVLALPLLFSDTVTDKSVGEAPPSSSLPAEPPPVSGVSPTTATHRPGALLPATAADTQEPAAEPAVTSEPPVTTTITTSKVKKTKDPKPSKTRTKDNTTSAPPPA